MTRRIHETAKVHPSAILPEDCSIGKYCVIGEGVKILTPSALIKDFTRIHDRTLVTGTTPFAIGYNCYVGPGCVLDTRGGLYLSSNIGIGAYSQLWTHILFGDTLQGCQWDKVKPMYIGHDVWFVGHCVVSPIHAEPWSMAMLGSTIVSDMAYNTVYAGVPAKPKDIQQKIHRSKEEVIEAFEKEMNYLNVSQDLRNTFNPIARTYVPIKYTDDQLELLNTLYPRMKFVPEGEDYTAYA